MFRFDVYQSTSGCSWSFKKKLGKQAIGRTKGRLNTKIHMICTNENNPVIFSLSSGNAGDAPCGRELIKKIGKQKKQRYLLMNKAYEDNNTRFLAQSR